MLAGLDAKVWNVNPVVATVDGFLSNEECAGLIDMARAGLKRATVLGADARVAASGVRTNSTYLSVEGDRARTLPVVMKIGLTLRMPIANAERLEVLHYAVAEEFKPHHDGFAIDAIDAKVDHYERRGGQRLFSTMVYLNAVKAGGATAFPELGIRVAPAPGRLLIFANTVAGTRYMSNLTMHAGEPVTDGEKWVAITWWRERSFSGKDGSTRDEAP